MAVQLGIARRCSKLFKQKQIIEQTLNLIKTASETE